MASNNSEQDSCTSSNDPAPDITSPSLLTLPATALTQIAQYSITQRYVWNKGPGCRHPLLCISRDCRDMVLSSIHSITLDPSSFQWHSRRLEACDPAPWARLLNRACCQATPGLAVKLRLSCTRDSLPELLQPGIDCGGWSKVRSLEVCRSHSVLHCCGRECAVRG
jgi:hypothetical protein